MQPISESLRGRLKTQPIRDSFALMENHMSFSISAAASGAQGSDRSLIQPCPQGPPREKLHAEGPEDEVGF